MNKPIGEVITIATMECVKSVEGICNKYNLPASIAVAVIDKIKVDLLESKVQEVIIMHSQEEEKLKREYETQINDLREKLDKLSSAADSKEKDKKEVCKRSEEGEL